jgi:hypothetical protein
VARNEYRSIIRADGAQAVHFMSTTAGGITHAALPRGRKRPKKGA